LDGNVAPAHVHAERQHAIQRVVARRDAIEHFLDNARLLVRLREHDVHGSLAPPSLAPLRPHGLHVGHPFSSRRAASAFTAASSSASPTDSKCSCATSSSTRRKWCVTNAVTAGSNVRNASTSLSAFTSSGRSDARNGARS